MKKLFCKLFGHKWRWILAYESINCIRCGVEWKHDGVIGWIKLHQKKLYHAPILKSI